MSTNCCLSPYALEITFGGSIIERYRLRTDRSTMISRSLREPYNGVEYVKVPGTYYRNHCRFDWNAEERLFVLTILQPVWFNGEDRDGNPHKTCFVHEGDVITVSGMKKGPYSSHVKLVRADEETSGIPTPLPVPDAIIG